MVWNKGLTKETDSRVAKNAEGVSRTRRKLAAQGKLAAWNKDLTARTDVRVHENIERMTLTKRRQGRSGEVVPWNKGLTKETDPRVAKNARNTQKTKRQQVSEGTFSVWNTGLSKDLDPRVEKNAKSLTRAYAEGRRASVGGTSRGGRREDLGFYVRSSWEANFARLLNFLGVNFSYEAERFSLSNGKTYLPDFCMLDGSRRFVEIKGFWREGDKARIELFRRCYPDIALDVIDKEGYLILEKQFSKVVPNWECL